MGDDVERRHRVDLSRPGGEGVRPTSGDYNPGGTKHPEFIEKKSLETEQTLTPTRHVSPPAAGGMFRTEGPGTASERSDRVTERTAPYNVDTSTSYSDKRRYPAGDSVHQDQRQLAGHSIDSARGDVSSERNKRLASSRKTPLSED